LQWKETVGDEYELHAAERESMESRRGAVHSSSINQTRKVHGEADEEAFSWVHYTFFSRVLLVLWFTSL
jgi:hypothetical protein